MKLNLEMRLNICPKFLVQTRKMFKDLIFKLEMRMNYLVHLVTFFILGMIRKIEDSAKATPYRFLITS